MGLASSAASSFNLLELNISNDYVTFIDKSFWGFFKKNEIKVTHESVLDKINVTDKLVMVRHGRKVKYFSLEINLFDDEVNKKIFSIFKSKKKNIVISNKKELKEVIDKKGIYTKSHIFLFPFLVMGLMFCVFGLLGFLLKCNRPR